MPTRVGLDFLEIWYNCEAIVIQLEKFSLSSLLCRPFVEEPLSGSLCFQMGVSAQRAFPMGSSHYGGCVKGTHFHRCFSSLVPWTWRHLAHQNGPQRKLILNLISSCVSFLHHTMVTLNLWSWLDFTTTICDRLKVFFTPFLPHSYFVTGQEIITVFYLLA